MADKQLDEFKLFVDNVQQNYTFPPINGIKINVFPVYTNDLVIIDSTYIIRIDIPKLNKNICASDGEKYMRFNASFRTEGNRTFVRIGELQSIQDKYNNSKTKNKELQKNLDDITKQNLNLEQKIKKLKDEFEKVYTRNKQLEIKLQNYDTIFSDFLLVKK